jgi:hypothetical protein
MSETFYGLPLIFLEAAIMLIRIEKRPLIGIIVSGERSNDTRNFSKE